MTTSAPDRERTSVIGDVVRGALLGDFAHSLGPAGAITQIVIGFLPVAGTLAAVRDLLADLAIGDALGMLLNLIAMFPVLGGIAKTAEVLHHLRRLQRSVRGFTTPASVLTEPDDQRGGRGPNFYSMISLFLGVTAPVLSAGLAIYGLVVLAPTLGWSSTLQRLILLVAAIFLAPVFGVIAGHFGSHRARRIHGRSAPRPVARIGLALGYIYLIVFAVALALAVYFRAIT